ncbi:MAG: hypothetical protein AB7T03_03310 [Bacilli bacterium]
MKIKQDYVSSSYHQVYFTFTSLEIQNIYQLMMDRHSLNEGKSKKTQRQLDELVMKHIETNIIDEEINKLDVIPISWKKYRYLNDLMINQSLVIICQFCILPEGVEIHFPSKIPSDILKVTLDHELFLDFIKQLLLNNHLYQEEHQDVVTNDCVITYDLSYEKDDFMINHIANRSLNFSYENQKQFLSFLDKRIGDVIILDNEEDVVVKAKITEITKKVFPKLTDELVQKCQFLNTTTVLELTNKVTEIYQFSTIIMLLIDFLAEFIMQNDDLTFDENVLNHYWGQKEMPKSLQKQKSFKRELTKGIIREYLIAVINLNIPDDNSLYKAKIQEEYEFDRVLFEGFNNINDYQAYMDRHLMETKVLQYCLDQGIIELPK